MQPLISEYKFPTAKKREMFRMARPECKQVVALLTGGQGHQNDTGEDFNKEI